MGSLDPHHKAQSPVVSHLSELSEINLTDFNNFNQQHIAELFCVVTAPFCYGLYSYCVQLFKNWRETEKVSLTVQSDDEGHAHLLVPMPSKR